MPQSRYLTKSKFKLGMQCPTKLFYSDKREEYANRSLDDPFLMELASGGFQVGALARQYFPGGELIVTQNDDAAVEVTEDYLRRPEVTLFEAAFRHGDLFVRTDIVVKNGNRLDLIEVKSKSFDFADESGCQTKEGLNADFKQHIEDVAFQKHVISLARPELEVCAHLMMVDKAVTAATEGLNQKFRLATDITGRKYVKVSDSLTQEDLELPVLRAISVDGSCGRAYAADYQGRSFAAHVEWLADHYVRDQKIPGVPAGVCKKCEFRAVVDDATKKCGYRECWSAALGWTDADFVDPTVFDVWSVKAEPLIKAGKIKLSDIALEDITPKKDTSPYKTARKWLQITKARAKDATPWIDRDGLTAEMAGWQFPLHFIDFETAMPAIPFKQGRRPYEGIAFQFSHHTVDRDGNVEHRGQFLETTPGIFPNYQFVRVLKAQLETDGGSIFRYHNHENSYLNTIWKQLKADVTDIPDKDELCTFIESIAKPTDSLKGEWEAGARNMIDLYDLVIRYYYDPAMVGSNSIKHVLPATLNSSEFLQAKYSEPIYGGPDGIRSYNFIEPKQWVVLDKGKVVDPYKSLGKLFEDESDHDYEVLTSGIDEINDGGAAMATYGKLQYQEMPDEERAALNGGLLRYCELDTLAMVMIYEAWRAAI